MNDPPISMHRVGDLLQQPQVLFWTCMVWIDHFENQIPKYESLFIHQPCPPLAPVDSIVFCSYYSDWPYRRRHPDPDRLHTPEGWSPWSPSLGEMLLYCSECAIGVPSRRFPVFAWAWGRRVLRSSQRDCVESLVIRMHDVQLRTSRTYLDQSSWSLKEFLIVWIVLDFCRGWSVRLITKRGRQPHLCVQVSCFVFNAWFVVTRFKTWKSCTESKLPPCSWDGNLDLSVFLRAWFSTSCSAIARWINWTVDARCERSSNWDEENEWLSWRYGASRCDTNLPGTSWNFAHNNDSEYLQRTFTNDYACCGSGNNRSTAASTDDSYIYHHRVTQKD